MPLTVPSVEPVRRVVRRDRACGRRSIGLSAPWLGEVRASGPAGRRRRCRAGCRPGPRSTSTVGRLSPPDVYLTLTFGYSFLNAVDDRLEGLLLGAGPDADRPRRCRRPRCRRRGAAARAAMRAERLAHATTRRAATTALMRQCDVTLSSCRSLSSVSRRRCRDPSRDRRSAATLVSTATSIASPSWHARARAEAADDQSRRPVVRLGPRRPLVADVLGQLADVLGRRPAARRPRSAPSISEPSASRSTTCPCRRRSPGISGASAASSRSSGRMPRTTVAPDVGRERRARRRGARRRAQRAGRRATASTVAVGALERGLDHVHRRAADEAGDEQVDRAVVELLRRRDLLQLALAHHGDAVAHRHRLDLVVGDVDRRHAELVLQLADLGAHLDAQLRVEVRERLVHQEGLRARARSRGPWPRAGAGRPRARAACGRGSPRGRASSAASWTRRSISSFGSLLQPQAEGDVVVDASGADRARSSGTPSRCRGRATGTWLTTRSPMRRTPSVISSSPATIRSAVVLPHPDGPTSTMNSPSPISRSIPDTARVPSG